LFQGIIDLRPSRTSIRSAALTGTRCPKMWRALAAQRTLQDVRAVTGRSARLVRDRSQLVRQLLTESVLLAIPGGIAGVVLAYACLRAIVLLVPPYLISGEADWTELASPPLQPSRVRRDSTRLRSRAGAADDPSRPDRATEGRGHHGGPVLSG
jgi:hypothetical protein